MKEIIIPIVLKNQLIQSIQSQSVVKYKILITILYFINVLSLILGDILMTLLSIIYKIGIAPILQQIEKKMNVRELFKQQNDYYQYRQKKRQQQQQKPPIKIEKKEESFDDFLQSDDNYSAEAEASINPLPETVNFSKEASGPGVAVFDNPQANIEQSTSEIGRTTTVPLDNYKTYKDDLKSLKGSKTDIEKLKLYGYNKYRFVSKEFLRRNQLISSSSDEDDNFQNLEENERDEEEDGEQP